MTRKRKQSANQLANLIPFTKDDPRINRKGVPSNVVAVRNLIRGILSETVVLVDKEKRQVIVSKLEKLIEDMLESPHSADRQSMLKAAYPGLLKDEVDHNVKGKIIHVGFEKPSENDNDE
jgi:hypothetical protein